MASADRSPSDRRGCRWPSSGVLVWVLLLAPLLLVPGSPVRAQQMNLDSYRRTDPGELPQRFRRWLQEEVAWIITDAEREIFLRLETDERRDLFIREFWNNRDPSPGTEANEYREAHYERLAYANEHYGRETPRKGWQTDRGRIHILLGQPRSTTRLPNTNIAVPAEVWFYAVDPALRTPPFFYLIFFRDNGVGEYRLYSPAIDGPRKLLNATGRSQVDRGGGGGFGPGGFTAGGGDENSAAINLLRQADMELANAASSLIPGDGGGLFASPLRSEMVLARVLDVPDMLMPRATWAYRVLTGVTESRVRFETLPLQTQAIVLIDPSGGRFVHFVARTAAQELNLNHFEDKYYLTFEVGPSIRDPELRQVEVREARTLQADLDAERARALRSGPVQYMERIPVQPDEFTLDVLMENNVSGQFGRAEIPLRALPLGGEEVAAGQPLLVIESRDLGDAYDPYAEHFPFQVGKRLVIPALDGPFPTGGTAQVFWQLYVPPTSAPFFAVFELRDAAGGVRVRRMSRVDAGSRSAVGTVDLLTEIALQDLPAGDYVLACRLDVADDPPVALPLRVVPEERYQRPFVHALRFPPPASPAVGLQRARQLRVLGRTEEAIGLLEDVLRREPELEAALQLQLSLLTDAGRFRELDRLLTPRLVERPNDLALLLELAEVKAELGEHYDSIRFFERARLSGAEETPELLNSLASEYYAEGRLDRARELLQRSLEMNAEQPQIRRLLDTVLRSEGGNEPR